MCAFCVEELDRAVIFDLGYFCKRISGLCERSRGLDMPWQDIKQAIPSLDQYDIEESHNCDKNCVVPQPRSRISSPSLSLAF